MTTANNDMNLSYWFEEDEKTCPYSNDERAFLIFLDREKGDLEQICKMKSEDLDSLLSYINTHEHLQYYVKKIVNKYSNERYEKYFGSSSIQERKSLQEILSEKTGMDLSGYKVDYYEIPNLEVSVFPESITSKIQCLEELASKGLPLISANAETPEARRLLERIGITIQQYKDYMYLLKENVKGLNISWGYICIVSMDDGRDWDYKSGSAPVFNNYVLSNEGQPIAGVLRGDFLLYGLDVEDFSRDAILVMPLNRSEDPGKAIKSGFYESDVFATNCGTIHARESAYLYKGLPDDPRYWTYSELISTIYDMAILLLHRVQSGSETYFDPGLSNSNLTVLMGVMGDGNPTMVTILSRINPLQVAD